MLEIEDVLKDLSKINEVEELRKMLLEANREVSREFEESINEAFREVVKDIINENKKEEEKTEKIIKKIKLESTIENAKVLFNKPVTIMKFKDKQGKKHTVKAICQDGDTYDKDTGLRICTTKAAKKLLEEDLKTF